MEELLQTGWVQGGFAFLFGTAGYYIAWRLSRTLSACQDLIHHEISKREQLLREMLDYMDVQSHVIDELAEYKSMEQFIRKEVVPLIKSQAGDSRDGPHNKGNS